GRRPRGRGGADARFEAVVGDRAGRLRAAGRVRGHDRRRAGRAAAQVAAAPQRKLEPLVRGGAARRPRRGAGPGARRRHWPRIRRRCKLLGRLSRPGIRRLAGSGAIAVVVACAGLGAGAAAVDRSRARPAAPLVRAAPADAHRGVRGGAVRDLAAAGHARVLRMGTLRSGDLLRMGLRASLLQATWNYERQQGLGWAWALSPALERFYPDRGVRCDRLAEHTAFFNTQPTLASLALGAAAALEEQRSLTGAPDADGMRRVKNVL